MSSAPTSLSSPPVSSEAFPQPSSVNHGVPDRLSSGLFQPLLFERQGEQHEDTSRRRVSQNRGKQGRKNGGSLNPHAQEFVPVADSSISGSNPNISFESEFNKGGGRNKGSTYWNARRSSGGQNGTRLHSVIAKEDVDSDYTIAGTSLTSSGGALSTALKRGPHGQAIQRASGAVKAGHGNQSSAMRIPGGQSSTSNLQAHGPGTTPPGNRKGQGLNANHLLNFQYDPIPRPPPRAPPVRRPRKSQAYNKELFLQANFRFLVSDLGDYMLNTSDPDKMLQWEDVAAVNLIAPVPFQCPICLDPPLCPQITTCGHIFCFPCILRYLLMGDVEVRGEHWRKCPLCFAMISSKELRMVLIENVHEQCVGDRLKFTLLIRAKGSIIPFEKTELMHGALAYSKDGQCHRFSKFTLTSDAEPTTSKAVNDLTLWAERVQIEGGEDMDLLPFVFVAIEQLRQRKDTWTEHRSLEFLSSSPPVRQRIMAQAKAGFGKVPGNLLTQIVQKSNIVERDVYPDGLSLPITIGSQGKIDPVKLDVLAETKAAMAELKEKAGWVYESAFSDDDDDDNDETVTLGKKKVLAEQHSRNSIQEFSKLSLNSVGRKAADWEEFMGYHDNEGATVPEDVENKNHDTRKDPDEREFYTFYQSADGQILILHPLNVKCLLHHYGSYEALPTSLEAEVLELETVTQTDLTRKRYRYLSHLPLTAVFQLCEVDLSNLLPSSAFIPFAEELRSRESRRRRILKQDKQQRALEERIAAAAIAKYDPPTDADFAAALTDFQIDDEFSGADFEDSQGSSPVSTMSPPEHEERKLFSSVAKLGFASGYDAPDLMLRRPADSSSGSSPTSSAWASPPTGWGGAGTSRGRVSFADVIVAQAMTAEQVPNSVVVHKVGPKKGKKASKVIMSTAGGRRY